MTPPDRLSLGDLRALLRGGLVVESGATADGKVRSYSLTSAGRILLANQLARSEDSFPTIDSEPCQMSCTSRVL